MGAALLIGAALAGILPAAHAAEWLGGVHFVKTCSTDPPCSALFSGQTPTSAEYKKMQKDCRALGGTSIEKAGTGTYLTDPINHVYQVTWDYGCFR